MTSFKKILSVVMAAVMLMGVMSAGVIGFAADADLTAQYVNLAAALKNEYVADLSHYTISNNTLNNGAEGFDTDANGFAYEHRVTAMDNSSGDILKAANRFYYLAESLMSTEYGTGLYDAEMLVTAVASRLKDYFVGSTETYYEDFYGKRYYPTEEELAAYENALSLLEAVGREPSQASLSSFRVYFMEKDEYAFYHVETLLQYFMGNVVRINAGNWYHRFVFAIDSSVDTWLTEAGDINNLNDDKIQLRKAVYEFDYQRTYNDTKTKSYYFFKQPELETVWQNYADEFGFNDYSDDLSRTITAGGQAAAFMIRQTTDSLTVPQLLEVYGEFAPILDAVDGNGNTWDAEFAKLNEDQLAAQPHAADIIRHMDELGDMYSNDALMAMFGGNIGNMISYAYILKPMSSLPERTVRGNAKYTVTTNKLNSIVTDIDNLVHNPNGDTAQRVATIVKQFFNTNSDMFAGTAVQGLEYTDLKDLVSLLLKGVLFRDGIINKLVTKVYPLLCDLIDEKVVGAVKNAVGDLIGNLVNSLLSDLLDNNDLAIYPDQLANNLKNKYGDKYKSAADVLEKAGSDWSKVNTEALTWGVDAAPLDSKASVFTDALCAALGGFRLLLVTIMCGDAECKGDADNQSARKGKNDWHSANQFTEFYDKLLINILQQGLILRSQGGYTKLIIPLLRALGLNEQTTYGTGCTGYLSSAEYHRKVDEHGDNCLKMIVEPIVYWVTDVLAAKPFETLWKALPNLVYLFIRGSEVPIDDDWTDTASTNETHDKFNTCQTHSIVEILDHIYVNATLVGFSIKPTSIGSFLKEKSSMISSVNGLLNEFIDLSYVQGFNGTMSPCAYTNGTDIVLKDSVEYVTSPGSYPTELLYCYERNGNVPGTIAKYAAKKDDFHSVPVYEPAYTNGTEIVLGSSQAYQSAPANYPTQLTECYERNSGVPEKIAQYTTESDEYHSVRIDNPDLLKVPFKIPQIQEKKITSTTYEKADGTLANPNAIGVLNTAWNTIDVRNPGVVLLYVLRFVISALGYKYDISSSASDKNLPFLVDCLMRMNNVEFVRDPETGYPTNQIVNKLDKDLFQGLNLQDIIYNVMLHPDEAICALLELFYSNETGNRYAGRPYTYSIKEINYHNSVLLNKEINPTLTYGTAVRYTKYWTREYAQSTLANSGELITNILMMLGKTEFKDGFGPYLENLLNEKVFNNALVNKVFNVVYKLLGGLNDKVGFDIDAILEAALDVTYAPTTIGQTIYDMLGYSTPAGDKLRRAEDWTQVFTAYTETSTDPITGETVETPVIMDVDLDWGIDTASEHGLTNHDAFLRVMSALLSPAAFVFRFLFMDQHIDLLHLIELDGYAGYQYAWIGLMEALSCPNVQTYKDYYEAAMNSSDGTKVGDARAIYGMLSPLIGLIDKVYADPITTVLDLIPNLLFFISIGGLNDLLNNLVHFAYVLLDILKPIVNGYDLLDGLLANIDIKGYKLNLSLPLDIDFNGLFSDLISTLVGDSLNLGGLQLTLPYIDFHTLCCGKLRSFNSSEARNTVRLDSAEGADLLTAVIRLVFEVIFMEENKVSVTNFVVEKVGKDEQGNPKLDAYDRSTLLQILDQLYGLMETYEVPDMLLFVVYQLVTKLTPVSGTLAKSLAESNMTVTDLFSNVKDPKSFIAAVSELAKHMGIGGEAVSPEGEISNPSAALTLLERIRAFFEKIINFFKNMFKG